MPKKLRPYSEYRDPGIPWLGEIPVHWKAERLKRVVKNVAEQTDARAADETYIALENVEGWTGKILPASGDAEFESLVKRFEPEDILFGKLRPYLAKVARPSRRGVCVGEFFVLRETVGAVRPEFLERLLRTVPFIHLVNSSTFGAKMPRADWNFVGNVEIAHPSREEQEHIVRFLDRVDVLVDRLIDTKQRLIEVLTEQKQATTHRAVTRGLDPDVPTKPTGLDWLPEVPEHWEIAPLRLRYSIELGKMLDAKRITGQHLVPYLRNVDVQWDHVNITDLPTMDIEAHEFPRYTLRKGDMLVCEGGEVGRSAFYFGDLLVCGFQKALHRVRVLHPAKDAPRFLYYLMYAAAKLGLFQASGSENTIAHLTGEKLRAQRFPFPPREEQQQIALHIDKATRDIEKAIERARCEIDLIREYHTRLISDVVTGKLDVREEAQATRPKKANKHFHRVVLAAEIVDQYHGLSKFGWIKLQKAIILAERHLKMDEIQSEPKRAVAGPFDNQMMHSIHKQLAAQKWFEPVKGRRGYTYIPMDKRGGHRRHFETYWGDKRAEFDRLLELLKPLDTNRAEIVATLYMAWNDFLIHGEPVDDDKLVHEILHNWDDSKRRFPEDRWRRAISWMRDNDLVPQGFGTTTTVGSRNAAD